MRLKLLLPPVRPTVYPEPAVCPRPGCGGHHLELHQATPKPVRDTLFEVVMARRYSCSTCGHTFRVYPLGINESQTSDRLRGLAVLLYLTGLSYRDVALVLEGMGHPLSTTSVYYAVSAVGERALGLRRRDVRLVLRPDQVVALWVDLSPILYSRKKGAVEARVLTRPGASVVFETANDCQALGLRAWAEAVAGVVRARVVANDEGGPPVGAP